MLLPRCYELTNEPSSIARSFPFQPEQARSLPHGVVGIVTSFATRFASKVLTAATTFAEDYALRLAPFLGAVSLNLKIIEIAERNISTGFDLAMNLAGAKNMAEAVEMQSAYWRKQLNQLQAQAEEVKALLSRLNANVIEPIEAGMKPVGASSPLPGK
jgi:hypothetical protein